MSMLGLGLPRRNMPLLLPRLEGEANRVTVYGYAYGDIPEADLTLKYVARYITFEGDFAELYSFCHGDDIEALMTVRTIDGITHFEVARMGSREMDLYFENAFWYKFPKDSNVGFIGRP